MLRLLLSTIHLVLLGPYVEPVLAATCKTATVGSPDSNCFDIYTRAKITQTQFLSFNPGLNCTRLQIGQKVCISAGTLPAGPGPQPNGTCTTYKTVANDSCAAIALKFSISNATLLETYNAKTYKWKGCSGLQVGFTMCISPGNPPPIPVNPLLQCGPESPGNKTCPLKACCSSFGFCGLTDDFCSTTGSNPCISNCGKPKLPSCSPNISRKIGYYAGWGNRRAPCPNYNVAPDQLDLRGYTHVLFAFAVITQDYKIAVKAEDSALLKSLVNQKLRYPGLKVMVAVGGWDFSEVDSTKDLFTLMISTSANRGSFITSVKTFLSSNGLDGIDIDFEYPGAAERNAPAEDTPSLTAFFKELRTALGSGPAISIATPAGYWFLRGFEIDKLVDSVSFINMMSYDYHGQWDTNITGQPSVASPHTSLKDMQDSVLLYTRAGINMQKVNLGLAWYARTFHLTSSGCAGYNCSMNGGGTPGRCSEASGYLTQFEVEELIKAGSKPTLDSGTQTYWFKESHNDLITFDQANTWQAKTNFAGSTCFGGTFVWSLDQLGPNAGVIGNPNDPNGPKPSPTFSLVTWNPNPHPPAGAQSETFVQSAGTFTTTEIKTIGTDVRSTTQTVTIPASTITGSSVSGTKTITTTSVRPSMVITTVVTQTAVLTKTVFDTIVATRTTLVIPIPTATTTVSIQQITLTLESGGTPINAPLPTFISEVSGITPTWTYVILPPSGATNITFTAPLTSTVTWSSTVKIPTSEATSSRVDGPPGSHNLCNSNNFFFVLIRGLIDPCNPPEVGIRGGVTPKPIKPPGWTGPWTDPFPLPTGPGADSEPTDTSEPNSTSKPVSTSQPLSTSEPISTTAISTSIPISTSVPISTDTETRSTTTAEPSGCPVPTAYDLPSENPDWETDGTDPDRRRSSDNKAISHFNPTDQTTQRSRVLEKRVDRRHMAVQGCGDDAKAQSPSAVTKTAGRSYHVPRGSNTNNFNLRPVTVNNRPGGDTAQEHVFELGYIGQFFLQPPMNIVDCNWIIKNFYKASSSTGPGTIAQAVLAVIDNTNNMVWVDTPMNQVKSNIVNMNTGTPQGDKISKLTDFQSNDTEIKNLEWYFSSFAFLGTYFNDTSDIFKRVATSVESILAQITPDEIPSEDQSIPAMFEEWLENTLQNYRIVDRANEGWDAYFRKMNTLAISAQPPGIPVCFPLAHAGFYQPKPFDYTQLLPPRILLPSCNVPGTTGGIYANDGTLITSGVRIMGAGNLQRFGLGTGSSYAVGNHFFGKSLSGTSPGCQGSYQITDGQSGGQNDVSINFDCMGNTGRFPAPISFYINNVQLECVAVGLRGATGNEIYALICGPPNLGGSDSARTCGQFWQPPTGEQNVGVIDQTWVFGPD